MAGPSGRARRTVNPRTELFGLRAAQGGYGADFARRRAGCSLVKFYERWPQYGPSIGKAI